MDIVAAPDSADVQAFQFKLQRRIRVFDSASSSLSSSPSLNLVVAASRFGLLFVGSPDNSLHVFQIKNLILEEGFKCPRRVFPLAASPINLSLNCSQELLSVVVRSNDSLVATIYHTKSCASENLALFKEIRLSPSLGIQLCSLLWNPCQADVLTVCTSDGTISVYQCKQNSLDVQSKAANARCLSWSPKGKQIVTGNADGSLSQYKPDLTLVKNIPPPQLFGTNQIEAIAIHWISNYQFSVVYRDAMDSDNRPCVTIVNTPKAGSATCINYEDICYSMGGVRPIQYYLTHFPTWGILLASSANSMEVGVLGTMDQTNWQQWIQMDEARAELPLTDDKQENYPVGFTLDDAAIYQLPWGDTQTLPHMPMIHILSHTGTLVSFYAINLSKDCPPMCSPPEEVMLPQHLMICDIQSKPTQQSAPATVSEVVVNPSHDASFVIPQNIITSTPTIPKSNSHFSLSGTTKPVVANLFGISSEQVARDSEKPITEIVHRQPSTENKPQEAAKVTSFTPSTAQPLQQDKPLGAPAKPSSFFNKPSTQPEKNADIIQHKIPSHLPIGSTNHQEEDQGKSYEALLNLASSETIKAMLLKEVNEFQSELYDLLKKCKSVDTQVGNPSEMKEIISVLDQYDREPLEKICSNKDVKQQITALKQSLIKMCSVLVKAQMQPESLELEQLAQLDPVSAGKMAAIKQNIYYLESQLKQTNNVLDDQWETFQEECKKRITAFRGMNDGDTMKMPTLDKVYQPLVRQHDILARQLSTIKTLQKLAESVKPQILSSKIGRPLTKAYRDSQPLSTLTKNLLNLSLQPTDILDAKYKAVCDRESKYTTRKQNALRELLANHHTVRIKPIKVETSNRLQSFFDRNSLSNFELQPSKKNVETASVPVTKATSIQPVKQNVPAVSEMNASSMSSLNSKMMEAILRPTPQYTDSQSLTNLNKFVSNITTDNDQGATAKPSLPAAPNKTTPSNGLTISQQSPAIVKAIQQTKPTPQISQPPVSKVISSNVTTSTIMKKNDTIPSTNIQINSSTFMGQSICSPIPRSSGSIFGTNSSQVAFGSTASNFTEPKGISIFSSPKSVVPSTTTVSSTTASNSIFKSLSFAPQAVSKDSSVFSSSKTQTNIPKLETQENVQKGVQAAEAGITSSSLTFGSLTISKVPSSSQSVIAPTTPTESSDDNVKSVLVSQESGSTFPSTVTTISQSALVTAPSSSVDTTVNVNSTSDSKLSLPSSISAPVTSSSLFSQPPSTTPLSFGTQNKPSATSIFGVPSSNSPASIFGGTSISTTTAAVSGTITTIASTLSGESGSTITASTLNGVSTPNATPANVVSGTSTPGSIFGGVSSPATAASIFSTPLTTPSVFSPSGSPSVFGGVNPTSTASMFGSSATITTASSMFGGIVTPTATTPAFGNSPQTPSAASSLFASANANITPAGSMFESLSVSTNSGPTSIFGSPATATTCASSLFGGANASVPATITSLFGATSISTTNAPFGTPANSGGSIFGGGSSFGAPSAFGQSAGSVFGGGGSAFGQPQTNVFGGGSAFGGFGSTPSPTANVFAQSPATTGSIFGAPSSPTNQGSLFGGGGAIQPGQSIFGSAGAASPASPQQGGSIFGSPPAQSSVFGGAAAFGSKPVFGQTTSFGSSPTGSGGFGSFSGSGDQQNVATAGFGSPSAFSKPPGAFGGSPSFGSPSGFGAPLGFASSFGSPIKSFGSPGTESAFGNSQSSTFENLATQSTITFGNLAQQSPPAQPAAPAFQGNPSFSMWR